MPVPAILLTAFDPEHDAEALVAFLVPNAFPFTCATTPVP
jgi:hypothetical protein